VVELMAFATRLGVIHHGVVIGQLVAPSQVEAVEDAVTIFALEDRLNLVAARRAPVEMECEVQRLPRACCA